jgi:general L-amino acid transport system permease protein
MAVADHAELSGARPPRPETSRSFFYDPRVRSIVFQLLAAAGVIIFIVWIVLNTIENLQRSNIASGFGFLGARSGFDISQTLIPYSTESTYARAFFVGLLNTLEVAVIGIVLATVLGVVLGVCRLSRNWLLARIATVYVEVFRNVPLLLQLFFWYKAVLAVLPGPRQGFVLPLGTFLNNRGLFIARPIAEPGFGLAALTLLAAVIASVAIIIWAKRRQLETGQTFPTLWVSLALLIGAPLLVFAAVGFPLSFEMPELAGFNFRGGLNVKPEFLALQLGLVLYTASYIGEIVRAGILAVSHGQTEAALSLGLRPGLTRRLVVLPQALRGDHSAADQPISEPHQELVTGGRHWLSRPCLRLRRDRAQPDRAGRGGDLHHHDGVSAPEPAHLRFHELVQFPRGVGGALTDVDGRHHLCPEPRATGAEPSCEHSWNSRLAARESLLVGRQQHHNDYRYPADRLDRPADHPLGVHRRSVDRSGPHRLCRPRRRRVLGVGAGEVRPIYLWPVSDRRKVARRSRLPALCSRPHPDGHPAHSL